MACGRLSTVPNRSTVVSNEGLKAASNVMSGVDLPYGDVTDLVLQQAQSMEPNEDVSYNDLGLDLLEADSLGESFDRTVASILVGMDMKQYLPLFKQADISLEALLCLRDDDLLAIGVTNYAHRDIMCETIGNLRKCMMQERQNQGKIPDLQDDIKNITLSTEDVLLQMCYSFKHLNALVLLMRQYRTQLERGCLRNQLLDSEHSASHAAHILSSDAITQAALLESQLKDLVAKIQVARPPNAPTTPTITVPVFQKKEKKSGKNIAIGAGALILIASIFATIRYSMKH